MSIMVGVGRGAQKGVLVKSAEALERLEKVTTLIMDKTGTLTEGKPKLVDIRPVDGIDAKEFLRLAASLEQNSEHPLAAAIIRGAKEQGLGHWQRPAAAESASVIYCVAGMQKVVNQ